MAGMPKEQITSLKFADAEAKGECVATAVRDPRDQARSGSRRLVHEDMRLHVIPPPYATAPSGAGTAQLRVTLPHQHRSREVRPKVNVGAVLCSHTVTLTTCGCLHGDHVLVYLPD